MLKTAIKGAALGAWVFVAGYSVIAWASSSITKAVEKAWERPVPLRVVSRD